MIDHEKITTLDEDLHIRMETLDEIMGSLEFQFMVCEATGRPNVMIGLRQAKAIYEFLKEDKNKCKKKVKR